MQYSSSWPWCVVLLTLEAKSSQDVHLDVAAEARQGDRLVCR